MFETTHTAREKRFGIETNLVQVKTFHGNDITKVEGEVNNWLKHNDVRVSHTGQSQSERNGHFVFVITVFYS